MGDDFLSDDPIIRTFSIDIRRRLGESLQELWMFGSRARGEARNDSDYDLLVVAEGDPIRIKAATREAEWLCMENHNALVSCIVYTPEQWRQRKNSPLGWNIQREGKLVA